MKAVLATTSCSSVSSTEYCRETSSFLKNESFLNSLVKKTFLMKKTGLQLQNFFVVLEISEKYEKRGFCLDVETTCFFKNLVSQELKSKLKTLALFKKLYPLINKIFFI